MHICLVSQEYPPETNWGGIATYTANMAQALYDAGLQVSVIALSLRGENYQEESHGIRVYRIVPAWAKYLKKPGFRHVYRYYNAYSWAVFMQLKKIHSQTPINVIETPNLHGEVLFWQMLGPRVPVVVRLHGSSRHNRQLSGQKLNLAGRVDFWHEKMALRRASAISAVSHSIICYNQDLIRPQTPVRVIANPLMLTDLPETNRPIKDPFEVLYAGRLSMEKGLPVIIKAIPLILEKYPQAHFTITGADGKGPGAYSMQSWAMEYLGLDAKRVTFTGSLSRKEVLGLYKKATVVVFPTRFESFGYITIEAMATGGIIVASNLDGPAEIIEHDYNGLLFEPGNSEDLAGQVLRVFGPDFPRVQMQSAGLKTVKEKYHPAVIARQAIQYYKTLFPA